MFLSTQQKHTFKAPTERNPGGKAGPNHPLSPIGPIDPIAFATEKRGRAVETSSNRKEPQGGGDRRATAAEPLLREAGHPGADEFWEAKKRSLLIYPLDVSLFSFCPVQLKCRRIFVFLLVLPEMSRTMQKYMSLWSFCRNPFRFEFPRDCICRFGFRAQELISLMRHFQWSKDKNQRGS